MSEGFENISITDKVHVNFYISPEKNCKQKSNSNKNS